MASSEAPQPEPSPEPVFSASKSEPVVSAIDCGLPSGCRYSGCSDAGHCLARNSTALKGNGNGHAPAPVPNSEVERFVAEHGSTAVLSVEQAAQALRDAGRNCIVREDSAGHSANPLAPAFFSRRVVLDGDEVNVAHLFGIVNSMREGQGLPAVRVPPEAEPHRGPNPSSARGGRASAPTKDANRRAAAVAAIAGESEPERMAG